MVALLALWSHMLAALLYGVLMIWQLRHWNGDHRTRPLVTAFAVMSVWAMFVAAFGPGDLLPRLAESARNLAFLAFMYGLLRGASHDGREQAVKFVYAAVAAVVGLQIVVGGVLPGFVHLPVVYSALSSTAQILGLTIAAGALVLVHNLYGQAAPESRRGLQLPMLALAGMWAFDLHLYTVAYLTRNPVHDLFAVRGAVLAMLAPLFALGIRRNVEWKMQLSRAATFQSISVLAILGYLIAMMSATRAIEIVGGDWVGIAQLALILAMTITSIIVLSSSKARAWLRVMLSKHFFEHRYDYRAEWLRFTHTVAREGGDRAPLEQRIVKALADIGGSPGGILLLADEHSRLTPAARWNWDDPVTPSRDDDGELARFIEATTYVVEFEAIKGLTLVRGDTHVPVPAWIAELDRAWAGIPLIHGDRLVGLVILAHPILRRPLDWEDFDLFRTAGIQAASYLAEACSHQALANAQRFDEFNRRFAFIMHDIKNLVSQLSLVARNAERHAANPEFRADMIATLQSSVKKMNDLLARLNRGNGREAEEPRSVTLHPVVASVAETKKRLHRVDIFGDAGLTVTADPARLEQALGHLVQNAVDASGPDEPVRICFDTRGVEVAIEVIDSGRGMSADFVRTRLFQPFASTKENGFGVGAFEARMLVMGMGGRIEVESREGEGSRFTIFLPKGQALAFPHYERMRA